MEARFKLSVPSVISYKISLFDPRRNKTTFLSASVVKQNLAYFNG